MEVIRDIEMMSARHLDRDTYLDFADRIDISVNDLSVICVTNKSEVGDNTAVLLS